MNMVMLKTCHYLICITKNIIKLNNSISFFATKRCHFKSQLSDGLFGPGEKWEKLFNSILLHFLFDMDIWSPANHSRSGTSSCTIQQNGRGNWRASFSLYTPQNLVQTTNKHVSLLVERKLISI